MYGLIISSCIGTKLWNDLSPPYNNIPILELLIADNQILDEFVPHQDMTCNNSGDSIIGGVAKYTVFIDCSHAKLQQVRYRARN